MIEHHLTHIRRPGSGTGTHNHHRARLEHRGDSVGYWRCSTGIAPLFACPDEPDPWVRLSEKAAARKRPKPDSAPRPFCERHPPDRMRMRGRNRVCADCAAEYKRLWRAAQRVEREAMKAA